MTCLPKLRSIIGQPFLISEAVILRLGSAAGLALPLRAGISPIFDTALVLKLPARGGAVWLSTKSPGRPRGRPGLFAT